MTPKRPNALRAVRSSRPFRCEPETELARLTRELTEEQKQRTATSEVLRLLSGSPATLTTYSIPFWPTPLTYVRPTSEHCRSTKVTHSAWWRCTTFLLSLPSFADANRWSERGLCRAWPRLNNYSTSPTYWSTWLRTQPIAMLLLLPSLPGCAPSLEYRCSTKVTVVGAIVVYRKEVRSFTDQQIELVKNFAAQAVIAIENARLLNELRQRTTDLTEALEQQTATSEVLQVISSSPGDLQPVFATMLENAARICGAKFGNIYRWDADGLHLAATYNTPPAFAEARRRSPFRPDPKTPFGSHC